MPADDSSPSLAVPSMPPSPKPATAGRKSPLGRLGAALGALLKWSFAAVLALLLAGVLYELLAGLLSARRYPPPGELHDIGGYRLHLHCQGSGSPTVLLDSGLGRDSLDWSWVHPSLAAHTRVCAYDRAGSGWSDPGPLARDGRSIASESQALLKAAGIDDPLVLVGHSAGGSFVQLLQQLLSDQVVAMVLVDVTHRDNPLQRAPPAPMVAAAKTLRFLGLLRLLGVLDGKDLPAEAQAMENTLVYRPQFLNTMVAENEGVATTLVQIQQVSSPGFLGSLPLRVITAAAPVEEQRWPPGMSMEDARQELSLRHQLQSELLQLSSDSQQIMARRSGHQVHKDQPELVVQTVADLLEKLRAAPSAAESGLALPTHEESPRRVLETSQAASTPPES